MIGNTAATAAYRIAKGLRQSRCKSNETSDHWLYSGGDSDSHGSLLSVAPPVNSLNIIRVIVSPRSSHSPRVPMIGYHVAVVGELDTAQSAFAALGEYLSIE